MECVIKSKAGISTYEDKFALYPLKHMGTLHQMISKPRIAFVDDEKRVLDGLKRLLRDKRSDWEMTFYTEPKIALAEFDRSPPNVAVVDIRMPEMSGTELAEAITGRNMGTVCIVLSGSTDFDVAVSSINDGNIFRYYVKPCEAGTLVRGIEDALSSRSRRQGDSAGVKDSTNPNNSAGLSNLALDMIHYGVIVANGSGHVLFTNERAGRLLNSGCGLTIDHSGICRAASLADTSRLHAAIHQAQDIGEADAVSLETESDGLLRVTVQPYARDGEKTGRLVCLFVFSDEDMKAPKAKLLMSMFDLTVSESRLAAALARGLALDDAAIECGITKSSARTYLKKVFVKLDVTRQSELVRKVLMSIASS